MCNQDNKQSSKKRLRDILKNDYRVKAIKNTISEPAIYEQMAEECCELAQACLKKARKLRNENFTPKDMGSIDDNVREELTDVVLCSQVLDIYADREILDYKLDRWFNRNVPGESNE